MPLNNFSIPWRLVFFLQASKGLKTLIRFLKNFFYFLTLGSCATANKIDINVILFDSDKKNLKKAAMEILIEQTSEKIQQRTFWIPVKTSLQRLVAIPLCSIPSTFIGIACWHLLYKHAPQINLTNNYSLEGSLACLITITFLGFLMLHERWMMNREAKKILNIFQDFLKQQENLEDACKIDNLFQGGIE